MNCNISTTDSSCEKKNNSLQFLNLTSHKCCFLVYQAHYRLGSSLAGLNRYKEAMDSFATALDLAETDEEKYDTLLQITTVAPEVKGRY